MKHDNILLMHEYTPMRASSTLSHLLKTPTDIAVPRIRHEFNISPNER